MPYYIIQYIKIIQYIAKKNKKFSAVFIIFICFS